jgi:hypothetical protein
MQCTLEPNLRMRLFLTFSPFPAAISHILTTTTSPQASFHPEIHAGDIVVGVNDTPVQRLSFQVGIIMTMPE